MDHTLDLAPFRAFAEGGEIDAAPQFGNFPAGIAQDFVAADHISPPQAHLAAGDEALESRRRILAEIVPLDAEFTADGHLAVAEVFALGMAGEPQAVNAAGVEIG